MTGRRLAERQRVRVVESDYSGLTGTITNVLPSGDVVVQLDVSKAQITFAAHEVQDFGERVAELVREALPGPWRVGERVRVIEPSGYAGCEGVIIGLIRERTRATRCSSCRRPRRRRDWITRVEVLTGGTTINVMPDVLMRVREAPPAPSDAAQGSPEHATPPGVRQDAPRASFVADPASRAFDAIAEALGWARWDYPGQLAAEVRRRLDEAREASERMAVREMALSKREHAAARGDVAERRFATLLGADQAQIDAFAQAAGSAGMPLGAWMRQVCERIASGQGIPPGVNNPRHAERLASLAPATDATRLHAAASALFDVGERIDDRLAELISLVRPLAERVIDAPAPAALECGAELQAASVRHRCTLKPHPDKPDHFDARTNFVWPVIP